MNWMHVFAGAVEFVAVVVDTNANKASKVLNIVLIYRYALLLGACIATFGLVQRGRHCSCAIIARRIEK